MYDTTQRVRLVAPGSWSHRLAPALTAAGIESDPDAPLGLAVSAGRQPVRDVDAVLDQWIVDSMPHLLLAVHPHGIEVGPWVVPGVGPCARCVAASTLSSPPGDLPRVSPALWSLAAGWVARDLAAWLRGDTPSTWVTSWLLGADPAPTPRRWLRHPHCGCSWFDL